MRIGKFLASKEFLDKAKECSVYQSSFDVLKCVPFEKDREGLPFLFLVVATAPVFKDLKFHSKEELPMHHVYRTTPVWSDTPVYAADEICA